MLVTNGFPSISISLFCTSIITGVFSVVEILSVIASGESFIGLTVIVTIAVVHSCGVSSLQTW